MNERQQQLFVKLVEEHIRTARPIGSSTLLEKCHLEVSPATVRNDLMELEEQDFLAQPHTSAGRVPTEKGYRHYVRHYLQLKEVAPTEKQALQAAQSDQGDPIKNLAKALSEITHEAVVVSFSQYDFYYTGLSYFFQKPEFAAVDVLRNLGQIVDHLDEAIATLFPQKLTDLTVLIGQDNPASPQCALLTLPFRSNADSGTHLLSILGPMRMDYARNLPRLTHLQQYLSFNHS